MILISTCVRFLLRAAVCLSALAAGVAWAAEPPLATAKTAAEHVNKAASVEFNVIEVKFAQRRKMHFLSATGNFRGKENLPVMIRDGDVAAFRKAGIDDLSAHYLGRKIRARGTILHDEGQWLLAVVSPDHIELVSETAKENANEQKPSQDETTDAKPSAELIIVNEQGKRTTLTLPLDPALARTKVTLEHDGQPEIYEGIPLATLLEKGEVRLGADSRGALSRYVVVHAGDKYSALFSLAELDPYLAEKPPLLAERLNGGALPANRGPLRVVVPADKHRRRWVGQVIRIEVGNAIDKPAIDKPAAAKP